MLVKLGWQNEYVFTCSSVLQSAGCQVPGCAPPPQPPSRFITQPSELSFDLALMISLPALN